MVYLPFVLFKGFDMDCDLPYEKYSGLQVNDLHLKYEDDAGYDLQVFGVEQTPCDRDSIPAFIDGTTYLKPGTYKTFCGLRVCIASGFQGFIFPRSSFRDQGLVAHSVWDAGFTGWVMPYITATESIHIDHGERVLQLIITRKIKVNPCHKNFDEIQTLRGDKGAGSTGRF